MPCCALGGRGECMTDSARTSMRVVCVLRDTTWRPPWGPRLPPPASAAAAGAAPLLPSCRPRRRRRCIGRCLSSICGGCVCACVWPLRLHCGHSLLLRRSHTLIHIFTHTHTLADRVGQGAPRRVGVLPREPRPREAPAAARGELGPAPHAPGKQPPHAPELVGRQPPPPPPGGVRVVSCAFLDHAR